MNFDLQVLDDFTEESESTTGVSDSFGQGRKIKNTSSICPQCLEPVDAVVFERHRSTNSKNTKCVSGYMSDNMLKIREARHPSRAAGDQIRDEL